MPFLTLNWRLYTSHQKPGVGWNLDPTVFVSPPGSGISGCPLAVTLGGPSGALRALDRPLQIAPVR